MRGARPRAAVLVMAWLTGAALAAGEQAPPDAVPDAPAEPRVTWQASLEWISAVRWLDPADTALNPGNTALRIPQLWTQTELRPDARVGIGRQVTVIARPRVLAVAASAWADGLDREDSRELSANWTELYLNWRPGNVIQLTYGLQNFQWGPAELLAPSNRIFHEVGIFRDPIYYVRGRHLARLNASAGKEWSVVALAELGDIDDPDFNAGEAFERQAQAKVEYSASSGRGYLGVTAGARVGARPWFGEYMSWSFTEGLSAYLDASHAKGSRAWYPVVSPNGLPTFARRDAGVDAWRTLAVAGLRYTFANGVDARLEYLHQDAGYADDEMTLAALALAATPTAETLARYAAPGLEFSGRRFLLVSVRAPDRPPGKHLVVQGRYLQSLTDRSGVAFGTASLEAADALVLFASLTLTHGRDVAEFSRLAHASVLGGAVWTW